MPLRDHFRPPVDEVISWEEFHGGWPMVIVQQLRKQLPAGYIAGPRVHSGSYVEIDVAAFESREAPWPPPTDEGNGSVATAIWAPPEPSISVETVLPDNNEYEVRIYDARHGRRLVAAIELVSPSNKDRPAERRAFAIKCLNYLNSGIGLIMVDVVTERRANLHDEMTKLIVGDAPRFPDTPSTYAAAYRPFQRGDNSKISVWPVGLKVSEPLPALPLWLRGVEAPVRVDLEAAYTEARERSALR